MSRYVVLEKPDARTSIDEIATELSAGSARVIAGWHPPPAGSEVVCIGRVATAADASAAVLCAVAGARLVVDAVADREVIDRLCDDLRRLGELEHRVGPEVPAPALTGEERALLGRLLGGASLGDAARELHLSRRTADRRLASARLALGANSTSEALLLAARAGVAAP